MRTDIKIRVVARVAHAARVQCWVARQPRAPRVLLLAVFAAMCLAARAEASCGDYLTAHGVGQVARNQNGAQGSQFASPDDNQAGIPIPPCRGPKCSRQSAPLLPPPPLVIAGAPLKAVVSSIVKYECLSADRTVSEPEWLAIPIHRTLHIFRPPRAVQLLS
jgi:hypothetical protein